MKRAALTLALTFVATAAAASEPELFGMGARSGAMAGTGVADAEGYDAAYSNPAGLVGATRRRLTVGYVLGRYHLSLDGQHQHVDPTDSLLLGAAVPLPFGGVMKDRLALGFAFHLPIGLVNRAQDGTPTTPRLALLNDRTQVVSVLVALGARVSRRVTVGAGVLALAALVGTITIKPDPAGNITTVAEEQLVVGYAPVLGVRVDVMRWLKLGAVFRGESKSTYDINVKNSLGNVLPIPLPVLHIAGTAQFDPMQAAVEASFRPKPWLVLDGGVTWKHWSSYPSPVDNATPGAPPQSPPNFQDTAVPRVAGEAIWERGPFRLAGRLGYYFEWSPAPQGGGRVLLDANRHVITAGLGGEWHGRLTTLVLDTFGQWHHLDGNPNAAGDFGVFGFTFGVDL